MITYRILLPIFSAWQCLVAVALAEDPAPTNAAPVKPNVIFILTDDQGYGDLSAHGHPLLKTPNFDRMHNEGVRFDNFYVSPSCSPTRAALLSGMHEFRNGVTHTRDPREHLHKDATILPQLLSKTGYRNGFIGKWHLSQSPGYAPQERGFDWCSTNSNGPLEHFDPVMIRNGKKDKVSGFREDIYFSDAMTFISESGDRPFFLYLSTYSPHTPLAVPESFIAPFRGKVDDEQAAYLGMVASLNGGVVGTLMSNFGLEHAIRELGLDFYRAKVGDRYVMDVMSEHKLVLGGESSGHIISLDLSTAGDGIISALQVLDAMVATGCSLKDLKSGMSKYPQKLVNVRLQGSVDLSQFPEIGTIVKEAENQLGNTGRVLLRPSGTEPLVRVMVEGKDPDQVNTLAQMLANQVGKILQQQD